MKMTSNDVAALTVGIVNVAVHDAGDCNHVFVAHSPSVAGAINFPHPAANDDFDSSTSGWGRFQGALQFLCFILRDSDSMQPLSQPTLLSCKKLLCMHPKINLILTITKCTRLACWLV